MCNNPGCKTRPSYNVEGETKALYCSKHKKEGMVDVINKICCEEGCKTQPNFNVEGETKGLYCSKPFCFAFYVESWSCFTSFFTTIPMSHIYHSFLFMFTTV